MARDVIPVLRSNRLMRVGALVGLLACLQASGALGDCDLRGAFWQDRDGAADSALALARRAFDAYVLHRERIAVPEDLHPLLRKRSGVFISAMENGAPRCCMGSLYPTCPTLAEEIVSAAVAAAGLDARRSPIRQEELHRLRLIVSIVAPPEAIGDPHSLDPVTEGLAVRSSCRTGVALPGETPHRERMIRWARIRARAQPGEAVDYFRVRAFRVAEPQPQLQHNSEEDPQ